MDRELFVQNIKHYCALKGVKPTVASRESGVGTSFIPDFKKGQTPSVAKVQMLAQYLGCTVSDLLGETTGEAVRIDDSLTAEFARLFSGLPPEDQSKVIAFLLRLQRGDK